MRTVTVRVPVPVPGPRTAYADFRQTIGLFGVPGTGKTRMMARIALNAPGAAFISSSNPDLAWLTVGGRLQGGRPVWWLNPRGIGGFPSNIGFSPLAGCVEAAMAMENAGSLVSAAPRSEADKFWDSLSKQFLQYLLHAAALADDPEKTDIRTVRRWAAGLADGNVDEPLDLLDRYGTDGWGQGLDDMAKAAADDEKYGSSITSGVQGALAWLDDPALAVLACPPPELAFDVRTFLREQGTIYAIGQDSEHNPQGPYFSCLTNHLWAEAKRAAADPDEQASCGLRLDPPLFMIVDEPLNNCRVPLHNWVTEAGGRGIVLVTGFQSVSQLPQGYGEHGGDTLLDAITVKMIFGGVTGKLAEYVSSAIGEHDTWHRQSGPDGLTKVFSRIRTVSPERLRRLEDGHAMVLLRNVGAFEVETLPVEEHPAYLPADTKQLARETARARQAIEAAARRRAARRRPADPALSGPATAPSELTAGGSVPCLPDPDREAIEAPAHLRSGPA